MKGRNSCWLIFLIISALVLIPITVMGGEATDRIKAATDKLIEIVTDHTLDPPEMEEKRSRLIRQTVDAVFDWEAFSQRALAREWSKRTVEEKKEFIFLFSQLLERTYMDKTRNYSGEKQYFTSESIDGDYGEVLAKVVTKNGAEISVEYRIRKKEGLWFIYDVYVEGVSLVNNYRVQFKDIITRTSYEELLKRLKSKLEEE